MQPEYNNIQSNDTSVTEINELDDIYPDSNNDTSVTEITAQEINNDYSLAFCAGKNHVGLVYTQISYLNHFYPNRNIKFVICHVDEFKDFQTIALTDSFEKDNINVEIINLANNNILPFDHGFFKGYPCKPVCLTQLKSKYIGIGDVDVVYFQDPFHVVESEEFKMTGSLLFHDYKWPKHFKFEKFILSTFPEVADTKTYLDSGLVRNREMLYVGESSLVVFELEKHLDTLNILDEFHKIMKHLPNIYIVICGVIKKCIG
eukprot:UN29273